MLILRRGHKEVSLLLIYLDISAAARSPVKFASFVSLWENLTGQAPVKFASLQFCELFNPSAIYRNYGAGWLNKPENSISKKFGMN